MRQTALSAAVVAIVLAAASSANAAAVSSHNSNITEAEVLAAQQNWGTALVQIAKDFETGGIDKARQTAGATLDATYGYNMGPVLFKPTLTTAPQTFRITRDGALAYFVGGDKNFPNDTGFALNGWRSVEISNAAIHINGDVAKTMGKVRITDKAGAVTEVDKTWAFKKDDADCTRIVLHHSSLPHKGAK
ncbi:MAG: hypothetical protein HC841_07470 [Verrucomicrobiae bacterium]|nr:hypothetical protein [Verrucomicrobiae bacterium]